MRRNCVLMLLLFTSFCLYAQKEKVQIKKGLISVDKSEAAYVKKRENKATKEKSFVFYDLQQQDSVVFKAYALQPQDYYFGIHSSFVADTADMKMEALTFTFNEEKAVTELLVKKYKFITAEGFRKETIKNYIANQTERVIPAALAQVEKMKAMEKVIASMNLKVTGNWNITSRDVVIGKVKNPTSVSVFGKGSNPSFLDKEGNEFAIITDGGGNVSSKSSIMTAKKRFEVDTKASYSALDNRKEYLTEVVQAIAKNGYLPMNMILSPLVLANEGMLVYGELKVKDHQPLFGFFSPSFLQSNKSVEDFVIAYTNGKRVSGDDDLNTIFFEGYEKIPAKNCDLLFVTYTYDRDGKPQQVQEGYSPVKFTVKYNNSTGAQKDDGGTKWGKLLVPRNYVGLYSYGDMIILSHEWGNKWTMARDSFTKEDLLEFAKDYPEMIKKIEADNDYLNGVEGIKKYANDLDKVIISSL